jgi:catechol 2,3-dioxygenase-like lactoylglutathione lyase family enzyme
MGEPLDLGCFSVSLNVADLDRSIAFYEALGFEVVGGEGDYRILSNGTTKIGLFHGIFEGNILTFNPGLAQQWTDDAPSGSPAPGPGDPAGIPGALSSFTDVREIERRLLASGIELTRRTETEAGADHLTLVDPDGNQILIDQFF